MTNLRIAAFGGFRTIPPKPGGAGSDKFVLELYPRIIKKGHEVTAYCKIYNDINVQVENEYEGIKLKYFKTVKKQGFDSLLHSFKSTLDIIFKNTGDIVHIHSGANSIWALLLRIFGKKVFVSQFAMDWKRDKWPWYGKLFYRISNYFTAYFPNGVIFDNIFMKDYFERKFKRKYYFIPYGSSVKEPVNDNCILHKLHLEKNEYFIFVGRFIPDKGIHILVEAFQKVNTNKKLVLIGGSPYPSDYENKIKNIKDDRIIFPGYIYGEDTNFLIKNAYAYIQPSLIEGLSPVILTAMGLGTPLICSNIKENTFITKGNALHFKKGDSKSLQKTIEYSLYHPSEIKKKANIGKIDIRERFNWDITTDQYLNIFSKMRY